LVDRKDKETIWPLIRENVASGSLLHTDGAVVYQGIASQEAFDSYNIDIWGHESVIHKNAEFSKPSDNEEGITVTTNMQSSIIKFSKVLV
jgi:hypothetical protein